MPLPTGVNLASKFEKVLDKAFPLKTYTDAWINKDYTFDGVNKITVTNLDTAPLVDYDVSAQLNRYGGWSEVTDTESDYLLQNSKSFQKTFDTHNKSDSIASKVAGDWMAQQVMYRVNPMIDRERFETAFEAAQDANGGGAVAYDAANILDQIYEMNANCDELSVPDSGRVMFIDSFGYKDIKQAVTPLLSQTTGKIVVKRGLMGGIDGLPIIKVPSNLLPDGVRALYWHNKALLACRKLTETFIDNGRPFLSGQIMTGLFRFDSWALNGYNDAEEHYTKLGTFHALTD
ncbi:MAG: hypothetical protein FWD27_00735 [Coriobacteriia bacterium]|nr:hypothetical protein [Coriobacteriia bacterium]